MKFKLKKTKPTKFSTEELVSTELFDEQKLPLVIKPVIEEVDLGKWIQNQKEYIDKKLTEHGAILFRDFKINDEHNFQKCIISYDSSLQEYQERSTPRTSLGKNIYTATEYPADQEIPPHNENAYSHNYPSKLWFCCVKSARVGGETPLVDSRQVYQELSSATKEKFIKSEVKYVRNYGVGIDLDWKTVFQTSSKKDVENYCDEADIKYKWKDNNALQTQQIRPATIQHSLTLETVWFNQAHLFHISNLPDEIKADLLATTNQQSLTRNSYFGNDEDIPLEMLEEIREIYNKHKIAFKWEEGDLLLVDNLLTAHGRNPFLGERKVLVAMIGS